MRVQHVHGTDVLDSNESRVHAPCVFDRCN
jgi:hypothetical protein